MGFLDLFRGSSKAFGELNAVRAGVKASLSTFVSERLQRYPDGRQMFEEARAHLIIGHYACEQTLAAMVKNTDMFGHILKGINSAPFRHLQLFFCMQQLQLVNLLWAEDADFSQGWPALMAEGACDMYSQPCQLVADILSCVDERPDAIQQERFVNCAHKLQAASLGIGWPGPTMLADRAIIELLLANYAPYAKDYTGNRREHSNLVRIADSLLR